jgi:CRP-like cAMP-binding protein
MLGQRDSQIVSGLVYFHDEQDQCVRIFDAFASDFLSVGPLLARAVKIAQEQLAARYVEIDVLMNARRLLKSAEQLGFAPVAYLPAFSSYKGNFADVVKMVKLNSVYAAEDAALTAHAAAMAQLIDASFRDLKVGVAILNLLRPLTIFQGLGDGELRKIARLFNQKLYREGECIFKKGDAGKEAYIVLRGEVDVFLDDRKQSVARLKSGQVFGELAFLDGAPRGATVVAVQPSILLVVQRTAFNELVESEPHLGMMVLRNIALDLSTKLRLTASASPAASLTDQ